MPARFRLLMGAIALLFVSKVHAASVVVVNTHDNLAGSLRQAIKDADPGDTIVFDIPTSDPGFNPNTGATYITLVSGPLLISKDLTVRGTGARIVIQRSSAQGISLTSVLKI